MKKTVNTTTRTTKNMATATTTTTTTTTMKRSVSCITTKAATTSSTTVNTLDKNKRKKKFTTLPVNIDGILSPVDNHDDLQQHLDDNNKEEEEGLSILMVDDNPINITILKKSLYKTTRKIRIRRLESASNGIEALHLLNLYHFDLILLDIDMPILNGIDTAKCIRKKGQTTPIIAVTTNDSIESRDNYIKIGMNDCLSKPVDIALLEQTLFKVLLSLPPSTQQQQQHNTTIMTTTPISPTSPTTTTTNN